LLAFTNEVKKRSVTVNFIEPSDILYKSAALLSVQEELVIQLSASLENSSA